MSLARAIISGRPRPTTTLSSCHRRPSSSDSQSHGEHHNEHQDAAEHLHEGFGSSFWRNSFLFSCLVVGFYKFAPAPGEDVYLTRWLSKFSTPRQVWETLNTKHLMLSQQASAETLLVSDARRPRTHRFRYPQSFDQVSPHLSPVGAEVDLVGLVVKGDRD